ncbi:MAG: fluoride efflux transporter CrcB [Bacteroides sp.]|nr:fluoride efflux transporter CrcB [Bacteroides sp.]
MKEILYIFVGGGAGSVLRYLVQHALNGKIHYFSWMWGTFGVNVAGSLLIGLFYALSARYSLSTDIRMFLTVGFCGGFTTFSTFSHEGLHLLKAGMYGTFLFYALASVALGILAVTAGAWLGKQF